MQMDKQSENMQFMIFFISSEFEEYRVCISYDTARFYKAVVHQLWIH